MWAMLRNYQGMLRFGALCVALFLLALSQPLDRQTARAAGPTTGDCCTANGTAGCEDASCEALVCAVDSLCCSGIWDEGCAALADSLCGICPAPTCPGTGDCCSANGTAGCSDAACCGTVCALDPYCCDGVWDEGCVAIADSMCGLCPTPTCPGEGGCCVANGTSGCEDPNCCSTVCALDPNCCSGVWDEGCAALANANCGPAVCPPTICPGEGSCCVANGTPGCDSPACCALVCAIDSSCCDSIWDEGCAALAESFCPMMCPEPICPGEGSCCIANGTPGCDDPNCCETVCSLDPNCCDGIWDEVCAALAEANCGLVCPTPTCPGEGNCCVANGTPSCEDATCCETVCAVDPTCCSGIWDEGCAMLARSICNIPALCVGDFDDDGDADSDDWLKLDVCFDGPDLLPNPDGPPDFLDCLGAFDADLDNDIDMRDVQEFGLNFTGSN